VNGKRLFLLRHAKSTGKDSDLPDRDRPLAARGRRASEAMSAYLREEAISPALVLCSSARRARETLGGVSPGLAGEPEVRFEDGLYHGSEHDLLDRLRDVADDVPSVMLIGHNPAIERLALDLARGGARLEDLAGKYPTGALAILELDGRWRELEHNGAELAGFVTPRELE
jgi:phosphohistidine phosphatase